MDEFNARLASLTLLAAKQKKAPLLRLTDAARDFLQGYSWPGNVRELENTLYRACALANTSVLLPKDIPLTGNTNSRVEEAMASLAQLAKSEDQGLLGFLQAAALRYVRAREEGPEGVAEALGISPGQLKKLESDLE